MTIRPATRGALAAVAVMLLIACGTTEPRGHVSTTTLAMPDSRPGWEQRAGGAALSMIKYDWRSLDYRVVFKLGRPGHLAITFPERKVIEIYVRRVPIIDLAHIAAHELGHAHDLTYNDERARSQWKQARGIDSAGWIDASGGTDFHLPGGDYAEVFAYWALGGRGMFRSTAAPKPSADELRKLSQQFFMSKRGELSPARPSSSWSGASSWWLGAP